MKRGTWQAVAGPAAGTTALALALLLALVAGAPASKADGPISLGISLAAEATPLDTSQTCGMAEVGAEVPVTVYVTNVDNLRGWELYLGFDPSLVEVIGQDNGQFLGSSVFDASEPVPDDSGHHYLAAASLAGRSGSGALTRVTLKTKAAGLATLQIMDSPWYYGPRLNPGNSPLGDINGDGTFDGPLSSAVLAIGESCSGVAVPTPEPVHVTPAAGGPSPAAGGSTSSNPSSGATPAPGSGSNSATAPAVVGVVNGTQPSSGGSDSGSSAVQPSPAAANGGGRGAAAPTSDATSGGRQVSSGDQGGGVSAWLLGLIFVSIVLGGGASSLVISRAWKSRQRRE